MVPAYKIFVVKREAIIGISIVFTSLDVHLNWFNWFHFLSLEEGLLVILIDYMIFLLPFLDYTRISTVSFLAQLDLEFSAYRMLPFDL